MKTSLKNIIALVGLVSATTAFTSAHAQVVIGLPSLVIGSPYYGPQPYYRPAPPVIYAAPPVIVRPGPGYYGYRYGYGYGYRPEAARRGYYGHGYEHGHHGR